MDERTKAEWLAATARVVGSLVPKGAVHVLVVINPETGDVDLVGNVRRGEGEPTAAAVRDVLLAVAAEIDPDTTRVEDI